MCHAHATLADRPHTPEWALAEHGRKGFELALAAMLGCQAFRDRRGRPWTPQSKLGRANTTNSVEVPTGDSLPKTPKSNSMRFNPSLTLNDRGSRTDYSYVRLSSLTLRTHNSLKPTHLMRSVITASSFLSWQVLQCQARMPDVRHYPCCGCVRPAGATAILLIALRNAFALASTLSVETPRPR
jgi:hypothetical protein